MCCNSSKNESSSNPLTFFVLIGSQGFDCQIHYRHDTERTNWTVHTSRYKFREYFDLFELHDNLFCKKNEAKVKFQMKLFARDSFSSFLKQIIFKTEQNQLIKVKQLWSVQSVEI